MVVGRLANTTNEDECWRRRSAGATSFCERYVGSLDHPGLGLYADVNTSPEDATYYLYNRIVNSSLSVVCLVSSSAFKGIPLPRAHTCGGGPGVYTTSLSRSSCSLC